MSEPKKEVATAKEKIRGLVTIFLLSVEKMPEEKAEKLLERIVAYLEREKEQS